MTTFTIQELNLPMTAEDALKAIEQHEQPIEVPREAKETLREILNTRYISEPQPTKEDIMNNIRLPHAPEPQPTPNIEADIQATISNICLQLQALFTVISQSKAQPEGENSLQECVSLTLQQADWFEELVKRQVESLDITAIAKDAVQEVVESEVESYFENNFDPSDHFDFGDAVSDCVSEQIDDVVSDKIDDAVDSYLSNATISISK